MMFLRFNCFEFVCSGKLKEGHFAFFLGETLNSYRAFLYLWLSIAIRKLYVEGNLHNFRIPNCRSINNYAVLWKLG